MKLNPSTWCKIQETLVNLSCPNCFSKKIDLTADEDKNAVCEDCECTFTFAPDIDIQYYEK